MKAMKIIFVSLFIVLFIPDAGAQQKQSGGLASRIKGVLSGLNDSIPIGFANVLLLKQSDSTTLMWATSRDDGSFEITGIPAGTYKVVTTFLGYEKRSVENININKPGMTINLGKIKLSPTNAMLGEITVVGEKSAIDTKIDRKVINVSKDISSTGGTVIDLLRNVPNLAVSSDGTVSLRGNSDVTILIDGRPSSVNAGKLDQISSDEIESIEIITNPTAKYNPEGKSGIINLKLKQKKSQGFNANAMLSAGTGNKYNANLGINYNFGRINIFSSYNGLFRKVESTRYLFRESYISDSSHFLQQNVSTNLDIKSNKITLGTDIAINTMNSLTISYSYNPSTRLDVDNTLSQYFDRSMNLTQHIVTDNAEDDSESSSDYLLGYKKTFDKKGEELTIDYSLATNSEKTNQVQTFRFPDYAESSDILDNSDYLKSNLQLNWILPIGKSAKLESGVQSIIRNNKIDYLQNDLLGDVWVKNETNSNNFTYNEQIHSLYGIFSGKVTDLSFMAGLRLEQTFINGKQTINSEKIKHNYFNIYPNLNLKYSLNENAGFQLSYSRRINRPMARQINPFIDRSNLEVYRSGNPDLKPEYINSLEAGYNFNSKKINAGFTIFYNNITDLINNISTMDNSGISHMFPLNISNGKNYGFELTYEQSVTKWWRLSNNGSFYKNIIKSDSAELSNSNFSYNARVNNLFTIDKKTSVQLVGQYTGPMVAITSRMKPQFSVDLAIRRDFFQKKLTLTARMTDLFNTLKNRSSSWGDNFTSENWRKAQTRVTYFSLTYNFGKNSPSKSTRSNENNESMHSKEIN